MPAMRRNERKGPGMAIVETCGAGSPEVVRAAEQGRDARQRSRRRTESDAGSGMRDLMVEASAKIEASSTSSCFLCLGGRPLGPECASSPQICELLDAYDCAPGRRRFQQA